MPQATLRPAILPILLALVSTPVAAQGIQRQFDVGAGGTLTVVAEAASIDVIGGGDGVRVDLVRGNESPSQIEEDFDVRFEQNGGNLRIEIKQRHRFNWGLHRGLDLNLEVPTRFDLDVTSSGGSIRIGDLDGQVQARTSGGSVRLGHIDGSVQVRTSGGSIDVQESSGDLTLATSGGSIDIGNASGRVDASTSGGSIHVARAAGDVAAHTSGGSIELEEVGGAIDANTSGGGIRAYFANQPAAGSRLSTSGGRVEVVLADGVGVDLDARASNGVKADLPVDTTEVSRNRLVGRVGGGGPELTLRASGGSVRLSRR